MRAPRAFAHPSDSVVLSLERRVCHCWFGDSDGRCDRRRDGSRSGTVARLTKAVPGQPSRVAMVTAHSALLWTLVRRADLASDDCFVALDCMTFASHPLRARRGVCSGAWSELELLRGCPVSAISRLGRDRFHPRRALPPCLSQVSAVEPHRVGPVRQTGALAAPEPTKFPQAHFAYGLPGGSMDHREESVSVSTDRLVAMWAKYHRAQSRSHCRLALHGAAVSVYLLLRLAVATFW